MTGAILVSLAAAAALLAVWHEWWRRYQRRQAREIVRWIERALDGHGHILQVRWRGASCFHARLRLASGTFRDAQMRVDLPPRHAPLRWLLARLRKREATVTFQTDLDFPPAFNLEVHNQRWIGRTTRRSSRDPRQWTLERVLPVVLTTRKDWHKEISGVLAALLTCRDRDLRHVAFRRRSPHFSATLALDAISPQAESPWETFQVLRELATSASESVQ